MGGTRRAIAHEQVLLPQREVQQLSHPHHRSPAEVRDARQPPRCKVGVEPAVEKWGADDGQGCMQRPIECQPPWIEAIVGGAKRCEAQFTTTWLRLHDLDTVKTAVYGVRREAARWEFAGLQIPRKLANAAWYSPRPMPLATA